MGNTLYYEDFEIGQQLRSARSYSVEKENAIRFAMEFDPQPMHLDEVKAKDMWLCYVKPLVMFSVV